MRNVQGIGLFALVFLGVVAVVGCGSGGKSDEKQAISKAMATLHPTQGNQVQGTVTFTREKSGIRVTAQVVGLKPGLHGFHIHEFGDCSAPDARNAGDHFNPAKMPHGGPTSEKKHVGDLGNIEAGESGVGKYDAVVSQLAFDGPNSIIGRSVIVHALPDDLVTQPTGGSGARQACGVIGILK
ncbi:MAG: superoxide dismutase family protein [Deltaproteobacteria bacterium]|nr:superoxide dismutase family protein [Deltaproteobacteria bacterium]